MQICCIVNRGAGSAGESAKDEIEKQFAEFKIVPEIIEVQNGYQHLDSAPQTLAAKAHRPAYGTDGDYFSKPSVEDIYEKVYAIMNEVSPEKYKKLY